MKPFIVATLLGFNFNVSAASLKEMQAKEAASRASESEREAAIAQGTIVPENTFDCTFITSGGTWTHRASYGAKGIPRSFLNAHNFKYFGHGLRHPSEELIVKIMEKAFNGGAFEKQASAGSELIDIICNKVPPTE